MIIPFLNQLPANTIKTTFVEQAPDKNWDQPWQDACEEAAFLNAHYFLKKETPNKEKIVSDLKSMFTWQEKQGWQHDIDIKKLARQAKEQFGYSLHIVTNPKLSTLKKYIDLKKPIIMAANGKELFAENKNFKAGGPYYHAITLLGYDDDKQQFIVHDVGTRKGAYFRYSYSLIQKAMHDLPVNGDKKDINSGTKKVLVLL